MGAWNIAGRALAGAVLGTLGGLAAVKVRDDRYVDSIWEILGRAGRSAGQFTEEMVADLPDPARRYFLHAIQPGAPLASTLRWMYSGSIKPSKSMPWMPLQAEQIIVKERGFVWKARVGSGPLFLAGADHYLDGDSRMKISLFGLIPVVNETGPDLARSALGRLLVESLTLPTAILPGPHVRIEGRDDSRFDAVVDLHGETTPLTVTVGADGSPREIVFQRWGNLTGDGSFGHIPYGVTVAEEQTFGGYTIPSRISAGWWYGTDRYLEVIRLEVDWAQFD